MNYQSLVYFKMVAEMKHFTRAADALFVTQPALSKAVRNLETELGVSLFKRDGRNAVLTQYGQLFYDHVVRSINELDKGVAAVRHLANLNSNTIFISALFSMYAIYLPDKVLRFRQQNPQVRFSLEYKYTTAVLEDLLQGRSELGLCSDFDLNDEELKPLESCILYREPIGLIVGKAHRFAGRDKVGIEELRNEKFIVYIRSTRGTNKILSDLCLPFGFKPNVVMEAYNDYGVIGSVAADDGVAIIPTTGFLNIDSVVHVPLDTPFPLTRAINLVWRKDEKLLPQTVAFRKMLIESSGQSRENARIQQP